MTTLTSPRAIITDGVRKKLLVSLIADLGDVTIENFRDDELRELLRRLGPPFLEPRLAVDLPTLSGPALRALMHRIRYVCRRHFE